VPQLIACRANSALAHYCKDHGLRCITYPTITGIDAKFAWQLQKLCKAYSVDIIHAHDAHTQTAALLAKLLFRLKPALVFSRKVAFSVKKSWLSRYKYNSSHIRQIICISQAVFHTLLPYLDDPDKLIVVPDGVDFARFSNSSGAGQLRAKLGLGSDALVIGTVASLVATKDLFTFIRVAKAVIAQGIAAYFIIIGEGPLKTDLQNFVAELELAKTITFLGFRPDVASLLPQLDLFMLTSTQEGMGSSILEAMASHVPVIATQVGGIPEIIEHGVTGLLAPAQDIGKLAQAAIQLIKDKSLRQHIITNAAQQVTQYSVQNMAIKTLAVYQSIYELTLL
jgi:glycosyltransferase involved in cell wall biosynthesis